MSDLINEFNLRRVMMLTIIRLKQARKAFGTAVSDKVLGPIMRLCLHQSWECGSRGVAMCRAVCASCSALPLLALPLRNGRAASFPVRCWDDRGTVANKTMWPPARRAHTYFSRLISNTGYAQWAYKRIRSRTPWATRQTLFSTSYKFSG
jgi:hypothetical protein